MSRRLAWPEPGLCVAGFGSLIFTVLFGWLSIRQHNAFGSQAFDLGIYDQGFWLVSRGRSFDTVRGIDFWGHHLNLIAFAYAPFYWLGAGPRFLLVTQAAALGLGAVPVYLLARHRLRSQGAGIVFAWAYLLYPPVEWLTHADFHPEALAVTPLLFGAWCLYRRQWWGFSWSILIALATREDVALVLVMVAIVMILFGDRRREPAGPRRSSTVTPTYREVGLVLFGLAAGYYIIAVNLAIPYFNQWKDPYYFGAFYGDYGSSGFEVAGSLVRRPDRLVAAAARPDSLGFYANLLGPWGWIPLAGPLALVTALPQLIASTIANIWYPRSIRYQYTSLLIAPITVAAIWGASWLGGLVRRSAPQARRRARIGLLLWMTLSMTAANVTNSPAPWARYGSEWRTPTSRSRIYARAIAHVPDGASVSTQYIIVPHLTHRDAIYNWPNPWVEAYWGADDRYRYPDPTTVEWVVIDQAYLPIEERAVFESEILPNFDLIFEDHRVSVLHRRG